MGRTSDLTEKFGYFTQAMDGSNKGVGETAGVSREQTVQHRGSKLIQNEQIGENVWSPVLTLL